MDNEMSETVYGTHEDSHATMSERVQTLAASIYKEFERMIKTYDENVVKELMPLVVGILEGLDQSYLDKQENEVELELLRDDNEQLLTQYEREKQLRKASEQKYLEVEDSTEEERKDTQSKIESLESIVRMFELKAKNAQDHIARLDDKEQETRKEYNKLHERYTELFKTHMDYMERTKILMGGDRIMDSATTPAGKGKFHLPLLRQVTPVGGSPGGETPTKSGSSPPGGQYGAASPARPQDSHTSLRSELKETEAYSKELKESKNKSVETAEKGAETESVHVSERSTGTTKEETDPAQQQQPSTPVTAATPQQSVPEPTVSSESSLATNSPIPDTILKGVDTTDFTTSTPGDPVPRAQSPDVSVSFTEPQFETFGDGDTLPPSADVLAPTPDVETMDPAAFGRTGPVNIEGKRRQNESSIYDEISFQDSDMINDVDDGVDITGMGREVENLILENTELLATKNALNVVKDDLIAKVDELSSEQEILREEIASLQAVKTRLKARVTELEEDLKKTKAELEKAKQGASGAGEDEDDVPMAQRKRFTRVEMARVLMERNQYKERLMELQEAVRWTEMIRASREHPELVHSNKKKSSIWNFFGNLVGQNQAAEAQPGKPKAKKKTYATPTVI